MTVLVAVASKHGATWEIAEAIGRTLGERGVDAEVKRAEDVDGLESYDAVILGSAVYVGSWLEQAQQLVETHVQELTGRPVWLFSSGPIGDPPKPPAETAVQIDDILTQTRAREHRLFAGKVDKSVLGFRDRAVMAAVRASEGDYRDWNEIETWAASIADQLTAG